MNFKFLPILLVVVLLTIFFDDAVGRRSRRGRRTRYRGGSRSWSRKRSKSQRSRSQRSGSQRSRNGPSSTKRSRNGPSSTKRSRNRPSWLEWINPVATAARGLIESKQGCGEGQEQYQQPELRPEYPDEDFNDFSDFMDKLAELREDDPFHHESSRHSPFKDDRMEMEAQIKEDPNDSKMDAIIDLLNDKLDDRVAAF